MSLPNASRTPGDRLGSLASTDLSLLALVTLLQLALCLVRSHGRLFWADELLGAKVLGDPSFTHMFTGWRQGADGGGGLYYLFARLFLNLTGLSELTLRLFSTLGIIISTLCIWIIGRRFYSTLAVTLGVAFVFFTTPSLLWQTVNGRFYGMLLAAVALASVMFFKTAEQRNLTTTDLIFTALAHALICGSHILGMVYSAALLLALFASDRTQHRFRPRLYLAGLSGWLVLPFSYRAIVNSTSVTSTTFWTQKPLLLDLLFSLFSYGKIVVAAALLLTLCIALNALRKHRIHNRTPAASNRLPVYIYLGALLLAALVLFTKSRLPGISIFAERYLIPLSLGTTLLLAELFTRAIPLASFPTQHRRFQLIASVLILALCAAFGFSRRPYFALYPAPGLAQRIAQALPHDHTVVVTALPLFVFLAHYEPTHHYLYLLDWNFDLAPARKQGDHSGERLMENWKHAGYEATSILSCKQILQQNSSFTILVFGNRKDWVQDRLAAPNYQTTTTGHFTEWFPFAIDHTQRIGSVNTCH